MKRILPILLLLSALPAFAQRIGPVNIAANLTCVTLPINSQTNSVVKISVTGTFSATLQPEIVVNGNPATNTNTTPEASTTAQSTITAAGVYNTPVAGADAFVLCSTSYASGTAVVSINASNGPNASLFVGGGGSGGVTTSSPLVGTTALSCPTCGVTGSPLSQFAATTSAQLFGVISDETGSGLLPGATSPTLVTPHVTSILDGNGNVFIASAATSTAVDSLTVTNAATANPAAVTVAATGSDTNIGLVLGVKGTGTLQFPAGVLGNPTVCNSISLTVCFWGKSSSFPFAYSNSTANMAAFGSTAATVFTLSSTSVLGFTNSTDATATKDIGLSRVSTSILGVGTGAAGTVGGWLSSASPCALTAGATIATTGVAVTICSWAIPTGASNWQWECRGSWALTAGTTPTIAFGSNYSQTPTKETATAEIFTASPLVGVAASNQSTTTTGAFNFLTSGTITTAATFFPFETNGTLQSSATAGTFILTVTGTGTSVAGSLGTDTECNLWPN